ncbi:MAG: hypothetical protein FWD99_00605 [Oscillospiraceae bacterium]|nr:hypothetical protein [Oscillospiraceae bacterium]
MTKTAFRNDFLRGLGSALIELQSCADPAPFLDAILYGCLHNTVYDNQTESERGWYLHQAAKLSGNETAIEEAVCQKFFRVGKEYRLFVQLSSILYHFAVDRSKTARNALYQQYERMLLELSRKRKFEQIHLFHRRDMFEELCTRLTSLDGWGAFKQIVNDMSVCLLPKNIDVFFLDWFYYNSKDKFGKKRIAQYLQTQSGKSPHIRVYYEAAKELDNHNKTLNQKRNELPIPTLSEVLALARGEFPGRGRGLAQRFAKNASSEDLEKLAQAAMNEPDAGIQAELLWPFRPMGRYKSSYVFPEEFLSQLRQSADERLRCLAYDIIGQNPTTETRKLARSLIQNGTDIENGIFLLAKNPLPEDEGLIYDAVKSFRPHRNRGDWHWVQTDARNGIEAMRGKPKTTILEYLYRNTLCGFCRGEIVRIMHKKGVLSEQTLGECRFDANDDIRAFAERLNRYRNRSKEQ